MSDDRDPIIDIESVPVREIDTLARDQTIGRIDTDYEIEGEAEFDLTRLRKAIIAFEEEFDSSNAHLAIRHLDGDDDDTDAVALLLQPDEQSWRAIGLARRVPTDDGEGSSHE